MELSRVDLRSRRPGSRAPASLRTRSLGRLLARRGACDLDPSVFFQYSTMRSIFSEGTGTIGRGTNPLRMELSSNAQAILRLTAPLIAGRGKAFVNPLTTGEYRRLARRLRELEREPADLLGLGADSLVKECRIDLDCGRLERLLGRGFLLGLAMERWRSRAIWVVSRADVGYPERLKKRLGGDDAPPVLYGCGDAALLDAGGLAVVGSRNVKVTLIEYTEEIGRLTAAAHRAVISGGARGIDQAAMRGAQEAGGNVVGILADSLERIVVRREHRDALNDGRLALISPYDPAARFSVGHAMRRNKLIYALADAALVVDSDYGKGGTWAGATEQLGRLKFVPVYVRADGDVGEGPCGAAKAGRKAVAEPGDGRRNSKTFLCRRVLPHAVHRSRGRNGRGPKRDRGSSKAIGRQRQCRTAMASRASRPGALFACGRAVCQGHGTARTNGWTANRCPRRRGAAGLEETSRRLVETLCGNEAQKAVREIEHAHDSGRSRRRAPIPACIRSAVA